MLTQKKTGIAIQLGRTGLHQTGTIGGTTVAADEMFNHKTVPEQQLGHSR